MTNSKHERVLGACSFSSPGFSVVLTLKKHLVEIALLFFRGIFIKAGRLCI